MRTSVVAIACLSLVACSKTLGSDFEGSITLRTSRGGSPPVDMVVRAHGDKLRFETPTSDGKTAVALFLPQENKLVAILDSQKAVMDIELGAPGGPQPNTSADTSNVDHTGNTESIAGYKCEDYVVKDPSGKRTETCIAQGLAYFDLMALRQPGGGSAWDRQLREKKMFPLRSVEYDATGREISRTEAVEIKKEKIDDALFTIPADYAQMRAPKITTTPTSSAPLPPGVHPR